METEPSFSTPSSSSPPVKRFDVFLSFRGEDTRNNFTGHLSLALREIGLFNIFKDDYALPKGKDIELELMDAIEDSQYAVVVLSENYATSSWCLKELAKIVECMGDSGRIRTIFYHVNPSHVRNVISSDVEKQKKSNFWKALDDHAQNPKHSEYIESWRNALVKIANQPGYPVEDHTKEEVFIEEFIAEISSDLGASIRTIEGLFGMTPRLKKLDSYVLQSSPSNNVCFIGIHGMGGIGKSTLARAYYKRMSHKFDGSSFLQNVREVCLKKANGLVDLQNQLLKDILKRDFVQVGSVDDGIDMIRSRLRCKKVLIVLDDVSKEEQLNALAEKDNWFGSGSIIIVTARDDSFLTIRRYAIYKAEYLNPSEALQLFSWKAFRSIEPPEDYKKLSEQVVKYASYLPLALTVLGSALGSKEKSIWNDALSRLSSFPEKEIVEKLKISFDDLNDTDKCIFLDIACFFNHYNTDDVIEILDSCGFNSKYGISNLFAKSLLSLDKDGIRKIWMHDLLEEMGKDIVRKESRNVVASQSRIWDPVDLYQILENKEGTNQVEAIVARVEDTNTMDYSIEALSHMEKLRLLIIQLGFLQKYDGLDACDGQELPNNLQYLFWGHFPYSKLPSSFQPHKLVQLVLCRSKIKQLWNNCMKPLYNLKVIDLTCSESFTKFEDFTVFPNLEKLILFHCVKLSEIHPSIKHLKKLILLDLKYCTSLEKLPEEIIYLASLQTLNLGACSKLENLPDNMEQLKSLRNLVTERSGIEHLPSSIFLMESLESVDFGGQRMITSHIKENIISYRTIGKSFFPAGWVCTSLTMLELVDCNLTGPEAFPEHFGKLVSLRYLDLSRNPFSVLPAAIKGFTKLSSLKLEYCKSLRCLEAELLPSSLHELHVSHCTSLASFLDPLKPCHLRCQVVSSLDCTELVKRQDGKITALASLSRFLEDEDPPKRTYLVFKFLVPQSDNELPSWFINQSSMGSISITLDPDWSTTLIGFAIVFCFRANPYTQDKFYCIIRVRCSTNWITIPSFDVEFVGCRMSDHLCLVYSPYHDYILSFIEQLGPQSCDTLEFSFLRAYDDEYSFLRYYDVHYSSCGPCGVRLVYEKDIEELKQITNNYQKDVQSSHSQSISQLSQLRLMGPIGWPLWTGLRGILDVDDNLELLMMQRLANEDRPYAESVVRKMHFGVFRNYSRITAKFLDNLEGAREPE